MRPTDYEEKRVYDFLVDYITRNTYAPTLSEISRGTNIPNTTVSRVVGRLKHKGYITKARKRCRTIALVGYSITKDSDDKETSITQ